MREVIIVHVRLWRTSELYSCFRKVGRTLNQNVKEKTQIIIYLICLYCLHPSISEHLKAIINILFISVLLLPAR